MKLSVSRSKNSCTYYVIKSVRHGKKTTSEMIRRLGEHSELLEQGIADPLAYCKSIVEQMNREEKVQVLTITDTFDFSQRNEDATEVVARQTWRNIGFRYITRLLDDLSLDGFLSGLETRARYDLRAVCYHQVVDRILFPRSKRASFLEKDMYLGGFDYRLQDLYRFLALLSANEAGLQKHLFKKTQSVIDLDTGVLFYDCTNFYFETEEEDEDLHDAEGDILQWGMRKYGACKEHRPNPIVQMGLFTDRNGIPISYCIEHGSNNEQNTILPLEKQMVGQYGASEFIYCSDAGLGSLKCRVYNSFGGRHYVVTHSLKNTEKDELELVFKDMNWQILGNGPDDADRNRPIKLEDFRKAWEKKLNGETLNQEELMLTSHDMVYKTFPLKRKVGKDVLREVGIAAESGIKITENLFVTFSIKYFLYQEKILDHQIERAEKKIEDGSLDRYSNPNDVRRLVSADAATKNGEACDTIVLNLNTDQIAKEKKFHGFYAIATNLDTKIERVLEITAQRWKIEQSFRLMKSDFSSRPVYVSTEEGIRGHFAICYMALLVYRIMERKLLLLNPDSNSFTSKQILTTLRNINIDRMDNGKVYKSLFKPSVIQQELEKIYNLNLNANYFLVEKVEGKKK